MNVSINIHNLATPSNLKGVFPKRELLNVIRINLNIYINGKKPVFKVFSSKIVIDDRSTTLKRLLQVDRKVLYL